MSGTGPLSVVAKLTDFGLSRALDPTMTHVSNYRVGTAYYMVSLLTCCPQVAACSALLRPEHAHLHAPSLPTIAPLISLLGFAPTHVALAPLPAHTHPHRQAPEVVHHGRMTSASDIYSLGVIMWSMLTNENPWVSNGDGTFKANPLFPRMPASMIMRDHLDVAYVRLMDRCVLLAAGCTAVIPDADSVVAYNHSNAAQNHKSTEDRPTHIEPRQTHGARFTIHFHYRTST
jgi:serine/threonine protein kinase